ncbi:hypothetical protein GCM10010145_59900 [Streptomyces ruber]|uniref:Xylulose 5-phosphate/Fructose 6-phosphate phosphoketolase N-terminal domain-containing protein n=2 Tax=Streptomyces TaxID=1883 RepID=A0A918EXI0_9ACTN|nr:hypothetical protein GCM10010145_59900 [Streptomyces ruber]
MPEAEAPPSSTVVTDEEVRTLDAHWRPANYLAAGRIHLLANPLLTEPLSPEHIKPRLPGHWGTSPGLNLVYTHLDRVIKARGLDALCVWGPGHGGPSPAAGTGGTGGPRGRHDEAAAARGTPARDERLRVRRPVHHRQAGDLRLPRLSVADPPPRLPPHRPPDLHVRGCKEMGTTTTPFAMVVRNDLDRYRLVMDVIDRVPGLAVRAAAVRRRTADARTRHHAWIRAHGTDLPEVADRTWNT